MNRPGRGMMERVSGKAIVAALLPLCAISWGFAADSTETMDDEALEEWLRGEDLDDLDDLEFDEREKETLPEPAPVSLWEIDTKVSAGAGYRDNVLLSVSDPRAGGFILAGLEMMLFRLDERVGFSLLLDAEHLEFDGSLPDDSFGSLISQLTIPLQNDNIITLDARTYYLDQVIEIATFGDQPDERVRTRAYGVTLSPAIRKKWARNFFAETALIASRQMFREEQVSDYWDFGSSIAAGWAPKDSELSLGLTYLERVFDDRRTVNRQGTPTEDTDVTFRILRPEASFRHTWDDAGAWHSHSRTGFEFTRDQDTDYFSYDRIRVSQQLGYRGEKWEIEGQVRYSYLTYHVQEAPNGSSRKRHIWGARLELRRSLTERLDAFARYERETVDSNDRRDVYKNNTWITGLGWQF